MHGSALALDMPLTFRLPLLRRSTRNYGHIDGTVGHTKSMGKILQVCALNSCDMGRASKRRGLGCGWRVCYIEAWISPTIAGLEVGFG